MEEQWWNSSFEWKNSDCITVKLSKIMQLRCVTLMKTNDSLMLTCCSLSKCDNWPLVINLNLNKRKPASLTRCVLCLTELMVKNNIHSRVRWVQLQCFLLFHMDIYKSERLTLGSVVFLISYLWICWFSCLWFSLFSACHVIFLALVLTFLLPCLCPTFHL